jgi:hypothetical protein
MPRHQRSGRDPPSTGLKSFAYMTFFLMRFDYYTRLHFNMYLCGVERGCLGCVCHSVKTVLACGCGVARVPQFDIDAKLPTEAHLLQFALARKQNSATDGEESGITMGGNSHDFGTHSRRRNGLRAWRRFLADHRIFSVARSIPISLRPDTLPSRDIAIHHRLVLSGCAVRNGLHLHFQALVLLIDGNDCIVC